jgi:DNA-binding response OmpR family regulator
MDERILIVGDAERTVWMREPLAAETFLVTTAENASSGYEELSESPFDLVIVDLHESTDGRELVRRIRANQDLRRISILAIGEWGTGQPTLALTEGADKFEPGPVDAPRLIATVRKMLEPHLTMIARASGVDGEAD